MEIKSKKVVYECPIFKVEERQVVLPDGEKTFWVIVRPPNVITIALTNDKKIVLIKETLKGKECVLLPGGKVDSYNATEEEITQQALLELQEEAGFSAKKIELLYAESSPWNTLERDFYKYVAWDLENVGQSLESGEVITPYLVTLDEMEELIRTRQITSQKEERALEKAIEFFKKKGLL